MPRRMFPFLDWPLSRDTLRADVIAGIAVALVLVPQSMAYAQLAGMPALYGLYTAFLPVLVGALWGSSRQLATGPAAVVSILTGTALAPVAAQGSPEYAVLAIALAFLVGCIQFALGAFRLGFVVNFLSHPVIAGFTSAAAIVIALSQLNKMLGVPMARGEVFLADVLGVLQRAADTHLPTLAFGAGALVAMAAFRRYLPRWPGVLITAAIATVISAATGYERGGAVVGTIPAGLPEAKLPPLDPGALAGLFLTALVIALVGFMEAISIAKAIAARTRQRIDANQELVGQGLANLAGSFTQCFPATGSFSRSAVNFQAGARTGLSSVVTAAIVMLMLLFITPLLYHLPQAVLAAVIMMAVFSLMQFDGIRHAWKAQRHDGLAGALTFVAALALAPHLDIAILAGAGVSVLLFLYRSMRPRVAILGRHPDGTLRDAAVHSLPLNEHVVAVRFDGQLYFANVPFFEDSLLEIAARFPQAKHVLVVGNGINQIDASGDEAVRLLAGHLRDNGVGLAFSGLKKQVLDVLRATGTLAAIGEDNVFVDEDRAFAALGARVSR
jgi:SulP family sulfate permease